MKLLSLFLLRQRSRIVSACVIWACALLTLSCARMPGLPPEERPASWAQPVTLAGVPNLHRVSEDLYRSAQPTPEGMGHLEEMGVRTVVSLRALSDDEDEIGTCALQGESLKTWTWAPADEVDEQFLEIVRTAPKPVLIHCRHGSDRTGALCARYRIEEEGWAVEDAIEEMTRGGFGFHRVWKNLPNWVREQSQKEE